LKLGSPRKLNPADAPEPQEHLAADGAERMNKTRSIRARSATLNLTDVPPGPFPSPWLLRIAPE
jgi:hypothetical protein